MMRPSLIFYLVCVLAMDSLIHAETATVRPACDATDVHGAFRDRGGHANHHTY